MFRAARSIRRRLPGPLPARRAPDVRGGAEHPTGAPEALPHPKISKHSGWCGTPSGGSHPAVRANTTKEAWGRPPPQRGSTGGSRGQTEDARGRRPRAVWRHGTRSPPACQRVRGVFRQHDRKIGVQWRHKALRPLKRI